MDDSRLQLVVKNLILSTAKIFSCDVSFLSDPTKPSTIIIQPARENTGPSPEFVEQFARLLESTATWINVSRRVSIETFSEKGPDYGAADSLENNVYKIKIQILH